MFSKTVISVLLSTLLVQSSMAQIDRARLDQNLRTLAADAMNGRQAGTEDARRAAAFLSEQFKAVGLAPLAGESFLQKFEITRLFQEEQSLSLNGQAIPEKDFLVITRQEELILEDAQGYEIISIGADDALFPAMQKARAIEKDKILLIHTAHAPTVQSFMPYLKRPQVLEGPDSPASILVLTNDTEITSLNASAKNRLEKTGMANVIGVLPGKGKAEEMVLFSAHYDHIGVQKAVDGDSIANGADDDASGTVSLIELASHFRDKGNARTLVFAAFTAEEIGGYGSKHAVTKMNTDKIVGGVNIEMIGKHSKWGSGQGFITGYSMSDLPKTLAEGSGGVLHPDPYPQQGLFFRSDNAVFARKGVPAHTVSAGKINQDPYYHTVNDEYETLDMDHMVAMVRAIAAGSASLVDGSFTPTRIDTSKLGDGPL